MSVRTKILATVATVATMTAIGTTKAYGLENRLINNIEKTQALLNKDKIKYRNINNNAKNQINKKSKVVSNKQKNKNCCYKKLLKNSKDYVSSNNTKIINKNYLISDNLVKFVSSYEGYSATPYRGADYQNRTIGYGHVIMPGETYSHLTELEAKSLLKLDLKVTANKVKSILDKKDIKLNKHQFDSLVSFAYNCGVQGLANSRLLRNIKNKANLEEIRNAFLAWRYRNGVELQGLKKRRMEEFEIYNRGDYIRNL